MSSIHTPSVSGKFSVGSAKGVLRIFCACFCVCLLFVCFCFCFFEYNIRVHSIRKGFLNYFFWNSFFLKLSLFFFSSPWNPFPFIFFKCKEDLMYWCKTSLNPLFPGLQVDGFSSSKFVKNIIIINEYCVVCCWDGDVSILLISFILYHEKYYLCV